MRGPVVALALCVAFSVPLSAQSPGTPAGTVLEFPVAYPNQPSVQTSACHPAPKGSTHEITFDAKGGNTLWITGQNYDSVVKRCSPLSSAPDRSAPSTSMTLQPARSGGSLLRTYPTPRP